jgi:hypothetical protein
MTIFFCVEDELSRAVAEKLIVECCTPGIGAKELGSAYGGYGYIRKNLAKFYQLSERSPVLVITDLDRQECAPSLRRNWLASAGIGEPMRANMIFCVAKTEIESWILADTEGVSNFLAISRAKLKAGIEDNVLDAKEYIINLAKYSKDVSIKKDLMPERGSKAATGLGYNARIKSFVEGAWNPSEARANSASLNRAMSRLSAF